MSDTATHESIDLALHRANTLRMRGKVMNFDTELTSGNWYLVLKASLSADFDELKERFETIDGIDFAGQENPAGGDHVYLKFTDHGRFQ